MSAPTVPTAMSGYVFYSPDCTEAELAAACNPNPPKRAGTWKLLGLALCICSAGLQVAAGIALGRSVADWVSPPAVLTPCHVRAPLFTGPSVHIHPAFPQGF